MARVLIDEPAVLIARFRVTTVSRGKRYTTIETGRGRMPSARRDFDEAKINAAYNAVYKHVIKPKGKSNPKIEPIDWKVDYPVPVTRRSLRLSTIRKNGKDVEVWRDRKGRFAKPPRGEKVDDDDFYRGF